MAEPSRPRRRHAAASARIVSAGLSSAAALGMVAGMAVSSTAGQKSTPLEIAEVPTEAAAAPPAATATTPPEVVVIRRQWIPAASEPGILAAPPAPTPAPLLVTTPARPAPVAAPRPAAKPVTRTRGS